MVSCQRSQEVDSSSELTLIRPGLRERFVFYQHHYCLNTFWQLLCNSLRIQWPFDFRDCYTRNAETGVYKVSALFDERISDIKSWAMGPDIFKQFPELYGDLPTFNHIPTSISSIAQHQFGALALNHHARIGGVLVEDYDDNHNNDHITDLDIDVMYADSLRCGQEFVSPVWQAPL